MLSEPERRAPARLDTLDRDPAQAELELSAPPKSGASVFTEKPRFLKVVCVVPLRSLQSELTT